MSCLDVMYQVYGPPQPYFAAAYAPYHQKLAYYSKMQEAQDCSASPSSSGSGSSSFSSQTPASIKEEEGSPEKERPPEAEYINSRCVLFTYFQGDISSVVDEHFSRALSQPSSYSPSCTSSKAPRSSGPWRADSTYPMSQRSFPASFWNSAYQAPVPAPLGSPLAAAHSELPFASADPYSPAALHSHLHQGATDAWHHAHPHHAHPHPHPHHPYSLGGALGAQAAAYPRPAAVHEVYAPHFDPRYGPLLMPAASGRPARLAPASATAPGSPPCELPTKGEPAGGSWATPGGPFVSPTGDMAQGLGLSVDSGKRRRECGLPTSPSTLYPTLD
ncbi:transcription cofactor vestigial-like protein 2 isoform X1 [Perognathus longimembris pacificus]|uniref:transcription cofactor vestigial-like protein 2 isoform X1 n=1 Tax=Perognathus longimembris pacificus TaxID=214514 RepID=UPI002018974D|nr:transcription cofactor vestigial-like protein 2 isoform X1 [Perognathus longimembris pacificus]